MSDQSPIAVVLNDGVPMVSSREVAIRFDKRHADVLRGIENLECSSGFNERNFAFVTYLDLKGEARPEVLMTRDGFMFLAMGFTGAEAARWKERFIAAFNVMEQELRQPRMSRIEDMARQDVGNWLSMIREARLLHGPAAAAEIWKISPLPPLRHQPDVHYHDQNQDDDDVVKFLRDCVVVTGASYDFLSARTLIEAFWRWQDARGDARWGERTTSVRLARQADAYRCTDTGKRYSRSKRGVSGYRGIRVRDARPRTP